MRFREEKYRLFLAGLFALTAKQPLVGIIYAISHSSYIGIPVLALLFLCYIGLMFAVVRGNRIMLLCPIVALLHIILSVWLVLAHVGIESWIYTQHGMYPMLNNFIVFVGFSVYFLFCGFRVSESKSLNTIESNH